MSDKEELIGQIFSRYQDSLLELIEETMEEVRQAVADEDDPEDETELDFLEYLGRDFIKRGVDITLQSGASLDDLEDMVNEVVDELEEEDSEEDEDSEKEGKKSSPVNKNMLN